MITPVNNKLVKAVNGPISQEVDQHWKLELLGIQEQSNAVKRRKNS